MKKSMYFVIAAVCLFSVPLFALEEMGISIHEINDFIKSFKPHPQLGQFELRHNADKPIIACYGGIGLRFTDKKNPSSSNILSSDEIDYLIDRCSQNGINRICANLYYQHPPSRFTSPPAKSFETDMMDYFVSQAHKNNIEVYSCITVFGYWSQDKPFREKYPEYCTKDSDGNLSGIPSPAYPQNRAYKLAIILESLSNYPFDGIQLDFIRWPDRPRGSLGSAFDGYGVYGYDKPVLASLRQRYNLPEDFRPAIDDERFIQEKQKYVSLFISELREILKKHEIVLPIGVYNSNSFGRRSSLNTVHQDWRYWQQQHLVDEHHPMFYMDSMTRLAKALKTLLDVVPKDSLVLGPLFLDGGYHPTGEMCKGAAQRAIKLGCDGIWVCRPQEIEKYSLWATVREISNFSISEIRSQQFDPFYENLLSNGNFTEGLKDWSVSPGSCKSQAGLKTENHNVTFLDVNHLPGSNIRIKHIPVTLNYPVCGMRSLEFSFDYTLTKPEKTVSSHTLSLTITYPDGKKQNKVFVLTAAENWSKKAEVFKLYENTKAVSIDIEIKLPPSEGHSRFKNFEVRYDPHDDILEYNS